MVKTANLIESATAVVNKSGSWAILAFVLILGIGYEAHIIIKNAGSEVARYVATSQKNLDSLLDAQKENSQAHSMMITSIAVLTAAMAENAKLQASSVEDIRQLKILLEQAYGILKKGGPVNKEDLRRMENGIKGLSELTGAQTIPLQTLPPPKTGLDR